MDVVLGRKTVGLVRGDIFVNGHLKEQATWSRVCGCELHQLNLVTVRDDQSGWPSAAAQRNRVQ